MDFNRLTEKVQQALQAAQSKAVRLSHQQIDVEHLLAALIEQENGIAPSLLLRAGVAPDQIHRRVEQELERLPKVTSPTGRFGPGLRHWPAQPPVHRSRGPSETPQGRLHFR